MSQNEKMVDREGEATTSYQDAVRAVDTTRSVRAALVWFLSTEDLSLTGSA